MTYETLCQELTALEREMKDTLKAAQKLLKSAENATAAGDVKTIRAGVAALSQAAQRQAVAIEELQSAIDGFDSREYFVSGDFAAQLLEACESRGINVKGSAPIFEMFPYLKAIPHNSAAASTANFAQSPACKNLDLPPVNLRFLQLYLAQNSSASASPHLRGIALSELHDFITKEKE